MTEKEITQANLTLMFKEIHSLQPKIILYSEEWMYHPQIEYRFRSWVESILSHAKTIVSDRHLSYIQWQMIMMILIFRELRNRMVERGFYSFHRRAVEKLFIDMIQLFPLDTIYSMYQNESLQSILEQTEQDFSSIKQLKLFQVNVPDKSKDHDLWIKQWLTRPHFSKYKQYYNELSSLIEKNHLQEIVIQKLFQLQAHPPTRRTLYQIIEFHDDFIQGIAGWLHYPQDPLNLSREEQQLFSRICQEREDLAIPLYMQWAERLIEKKTSQHYKKAISLLIELKTVLTFAGNEKEFQQFIAILKKRFKGYAAFYEELKDL